MVDFTISEQVCWRFSVFGALNVGFLYFFLKTLIDLSTMETLFGIPSDNLLSLEASKVVFANGRAVGEATRWYLELC
jgi:hypothetical protein